jgi:hypothetical protein
MAVEGWGIYVAAFFFKYDLDECEFSEVYKEISSCLSWDVGLVLKLKLALVTAYLCRAKYFRRCSFC